MKPTVERGRTTETTFSSSTNDLMRIAVQQLPMAPDASELLDAVQYYNTRIYFEILPMEALGTNSWLFPLYPSDVQKGIQRPDYVRFSLLGMTLGHRINRTTDRYQQEVLAKSYCEYRGRVIRSLTESIRAQKNQPDDLVLAGIMTLLLTDAQHGASLDSRCHLEAILRIIRLRGGIVKVAQAEHLDSLLICFMSIAVFANTSAPAHDLLMTETQVNGLKDLARQFDSRTFIFSACPLSLFSAIANINHLRQRAVHLEATSAEKLHDEAVTLLKFIQVFSPSDWAASKPACKSEWELLGEVYQSAAALYCISSMQSLSVLGYTTELKAYHDALGTGLQGRLQTAFLSPRISRFLFWPLMVLGVAAARGSDAMRTFVAGELSSMSFRIGTRVPFIARTLLGTFWSSGETHWDACFHQPFAFTTQIAVDTSRMET